LAFYGLGLNNTIVLHAIGYADGDTMYHKLHNQAVGMIILACAGSIPGYWAAVFTVDTVGRKPLQIVGFLLLTILFSVLGFKLHDLSETTLLALYVVGQFLFNMGPNTTTFIVAGECFPTRYRSTAHGISAAMGKLGAILAQVISIPLLRRDAPDACEGNDCSPWLDRLLQLFALFMLLGTLVSFMIPETKGLTLEELAGEPRTSYNSGRNGSIGMIPPKPQPWNPFRGGQPAGFYYPRMHARGLKGDRSPRVVSPRNSSGSVRQRAPHFWNRRRRARDSGQGSTNITLTSRPSGTSQDISTAETTQIAGAASWPLPEQPPALAAPTWGAGWGRIDRGRPPPGMSEVELHDVGMLLDENDQPQRSLRD
jgi:MFS transporter, PHS family, inorganic phosphate transporter